MDGSVTFEYVVLDAPDERGRVVRSTVAPLLHQLLIAGTLAQQRLDALQHGLRGKVGFDLESVPGHRAGY